MPSSLLRFVDVPVAPGEPVLTAAASEVPAIRAGGATAGAACAWNTVPED